MPSSLRIASDALPLLSRWPRIQPIRASQRGEPRRDLSTEREQRSTRLASRTELSSSTASLQAMPKASTPSPTRQAYRCGECGWESLKWVGRCGECQAWGSVEQLGVQRLAPVLAG